MSKKVIIYHNPRCSKSREALVKLQEKGLEVEVVEYLKNPPDEKKLKELISKLGIAPEDLLRKGEELFKTDFKDKKFKEKQWIKILAENPILIERPVIETDTKAVIARPADKINEIL